MSDASHNEIRHPIYLRYRRSAYLSHNNVRDLRIECNGRRLIEGKDYLADYHEGTLFPIADVPPFEGIATFSARSTRYDVIFLDRKARKTELVHGPERGFDVTDHLPATPPGKVRLASFHVAEDTQVIEIKQPNLEWVKECQERLPNLARLMRAGEPVRLMGYGTSLTAQGGPVPEEFYVPNGASRDCLKFYYAPSRLAPDTIAQIPIADGHVHAGFNWFLKAAIDRRSSTTYLNMGISGSTTGDGETPNGFPNGNNEKRLLVARELKPDVVVIEYCINDLDDPNLESNLKRMIEALRSLKTDIIVLGCPGFPSFRSSQHWARGEDAARLAANATGAAFVPFAPLIGPGNEGVTGLAKRTLCSANGVNHPGPTEMAIYGRWLAQVVPL